MGRSTNSTNAAADEAMSRYAAGSEDAFGNLYELVAPRLFAYLLNRTRNTEQAEDLLQQTLLQVHRARGSFIPGAGVLPWVLAIARRLVIDRARRAHREPILIDIDALRTIAKTAGADDLVHARQLAWRIERELARLPEPQRIAFELLKQRGLSLAETSAALNITVGAVKLRMHRAHQALRAAIEQMNDLP